MRAEAGTRSALRRAAAACCVVVSALALAGCVPESPDPTKSPAPKPTPLFATDEEALAAATAAYSRYLEVSDEVGQGGWLDTAPLKGVATGTALDSDLDLAKQSRQQGIHQSGFSAFRNVTLQSFDARRVVIYACVDVSAVDLLDANGASVLSDGRTTDASVQLAFTSADHELLLERNEPWAQDLC